MRTRDRIRDKGRGRGRAKNSEVVIERKEMERKWCRGGGEGGGGGEVKERLWRRKDKREIWTQERTIMKEERRKKEEREGNYEGILLISNIHIIYLLDFSLIPQGTLVLNRVVKCVL